MRVRILPLSMIDDNRTILQEIMRVRKYLEENPIRNIFFINADYVVGTIAYNVSDIYINNGLDVTASADDGLVFKNGYIGIIDSIGDEYVTVQGVQPFRGEKGDTGATGASISSITKTGTSGLVDTYTITLTNGVTSTFTVTNGADGQNGQDGANGVSITGVTKTGTSGLVDTYTITFSNGTSSTFTVTNGADGQNGQDGVGVPSGGTTGQMLSKNSDTNYDTKWVDPPSGGSSAKIIGKNLIINPTFGINQRNFNAGSSQTISTATYVQDRWYAEAGTVYVGSADNVISAGKLHQFIINDYSHSKYAVCGIRYNTGWTSVEPTIGLAYKPLGSLVNLQAINNTPIVIDCGVNQKQIINVYQLPIDVDYEYLDFSISYNGNARVIGAFMYSVDGYSNGDFNTTIFPIIYDEVEELDKCKYYYEKINNDIRVKEAFIYSSTGRIILYLAYTKKRISPTASGICGISILDIGQTDGDTISMTYSAATRYVAVYYVTIIANRIYGCSRTDGIEYDAEIYPS